MRPNIFCFHPVTNYYFFIKYSNPKYLKGD